MPRRRKQTKLPKGWLDRKWQSPSGARNIVDAMALTFASEHGRAVLNYWLDTIYCTVCHTNDPMDLAYHNGQRTVIHDMLQKLDEHAHPDKYKAPEPVIEAADARLQ